MSDVTPAFTYLIVRTTRNQLMRQVARLRNPRYAVALLAGIAYFVLVFGRSSAPINADNPMNGDGMVAVMATVGEVLVLAFACGLWLLGGASTALAYKAAEIQMLFPGPVSRRGLVAYKVARSQLVILLNALVWALLLRRFGGTIPWPMRFAGAWALFSVLSFHRLGIALLQVRPLSVSRRLALACGRVLAAAAILAIVLGVGPSLLQLRATGTAGLRAVETALGTRPAVYALAPAHALLAPLHAATGTAWIVAFALLLAIIGAHLAWIFAMDVPFEDVAGEASVKLASRVAAARSLRGGAAVARPLKKARNWLPLAPTGHPAVAIAWKNTIALARTGMLRSLLITLVMMVVMQRLISSGTGRHPDGALGAMSAVFVMLLVVMGPRFVRNDLRQDLLHLASLKSYPLSGAAVVLAEMASPALVLTTLQCMLIGVGYFALPAEAASDLAGKTATTLLVLAPIALLSLNALNIGIQNAAAVLFPGWIRIGTDSGGIEAMGQTMLLTIGSLLALLLALLLPVGAALGAFAGATRAFGIPMIEVAVVIGAAVAVGEVWLLVRAVGSAFERMETTAIV
jgi:ABC-2 type transport system permease protein